MNPCPKHGTHMDNCWDCCEEHWQDRIAELEAQLAEMEQKIATMTRSWFTQHNQVALMQNDKTYILSVDDFIAKAQEVEK